jgi:hypothetical protein
MFDSMVANHREVGDGIDGGASRRFHGGEDAGIGAVQP